MRWGMVVPQWQIYINWLFRPFQLNGQVCVCLCLCLCVNTSMHIIRQTGEANMDNPALGIVIHPVLAVTAVHLLARV